MNNTMTQHAQSTTNWTTTVTSDADYGDYYDIELRARTFLCQPHQLVALFLSIFAIVFNVMCIVAMLHSTRRASPHLRLLVSLALSDIMISVSFLLFLVNIIVNPRHPLGVGDFDDRVRSRCGQVMTKALNTAALNLTLLNLLGLAVDHYLAILRPLHYPQLMNRQRANLMIAAFWLAAIILGFSDFISPATPYHRVHLGRYNYCEAVWISDYHEEYSVFFVAFFGFLAMVVAYWRIYARIRRRQHGCVQANSRDGDGFTEDGDHHGGNRCPQLRRNRRALVTTLLIVGCFVVCWLPSCVYQLTLIIGAHIAPELLRRNMSRLYNANGYLYDLFLLNCISDPIIYCLRLPEVKCGYRNLMRRLVRRSAADKTSLEFDCMVVHASRGTSDKRSNCGDSNATAKV